MKILVTGMSGLIGGALRGQLQGDAELTAFNRSAVEGIPTTRADLQDADALRRACEGQDVVVHLAAKAGEQFTWEELRDTNMEGTRNVFNAALEAGCRRVVFASSGATVAGWELEEPYRSLVEARYEDAPAEWPLINHQMATRPRGVYGTTKVWGEALARHTVDSSDMSILNVRIGYVNEEDRPIHPRHYAVWCSQRDVVDGFVRCVHAPAEMKFDTFFVNSQNRWGYRDLAHSRAELGFEPADAAEDRR